MLCPFTFLSSMIVFLFEDYEIGGTWGPIAKLTSAERKRRLTSSTFKRILKAGMPRRQRDSFLYIMADCGVQTHLEKYLEEEKGWSEDGAYG